MQPTVLRILINRRERIVGKIISMPKNDTIPQLAGYWAFFRSCNWKDVVSHKLRAVSVDDSSWEYCNNLGIKGMIVYCPDVSRIITVKSVAINNSRVVDMGDEFPQRRIALNKCKIYNNAKPITTPWITNIVTLEPKLDWEEEVQPLKLFE